MRRHTLFRWLAIVIGLAGSTSWPGVLFAADTPRPAPAVTPAAITAAELDRRIERYWIDARTAIAPQTSDEEFLRRVTLDLAGTLPTPREITLFGLDPNPEKRALVIERLLGSPEFAKSWAQYWREVIFSRATEMRSRINQGAFETWMEEQLQANTGWDKIATELLTATGDVQNTGAVALVFAQGGDANEIASEASRIFLGIQIQCANCHDHPTDRWTREQFHQLAAFFPRTQVRPVRTGERRSFEVVSFDQSPRLGGGNPLQALQANAEQFVRRRDDNGDGKLSAKEVEGTPLERAFSRVVQLGDSNKDGSLTAAEIKGVTLPAPPMGRGQTEHFMPDLENPQDRGKRMDPVFFVNNENPGAGMTDQLRRAAAARYFVGVENPWFARALVNRIWAELLGEGFYMPVDDIGPERTAQCEEVLDLLADGFVASGYDLKWLYRTITLSATYQRQIQAAEGEIAFAVIQPTRLRGDQLFDALDEVVGISQMNRGRRRPGMGMGMGRRYDFSVRGQFTRLFGFDPSTPQDDVTSTVPQALFLMNSPAIGNAVRANDRTKLGQIVADYPNDDDALTELYLLVLARQPTEGEVRIAKEYLREVGQREEAYEDLMWSLLNSAEFLTKR